MSNHTPGPWHYGEDRVGRKRVFDTTGHEVVRAMSEGSYPNRRPVAEREANARLIAAAPDMLAALHVLVACFGETHKNLYAIRDARDAIAKAEGR